MAPRPPFQYGNTLDKDAAIYSGDVLFGVGDDKVQLPVTSTFITTIRCLTRTAAIRLLRPS